MGSHGGVPAVAPQQWAVMEVFLRSLLSSGESWRCSCGRSSVVGGHGGVPAVAPQ